jgi:hypothetical protein
MTTIVDEFTNGMSADTARANMRAVVEAYGYDGSGNAGDVRAFANTLLVPAGRSIGAAELGGGLRDDWNLLNNPAALTQAMLDLIAGSQHFPILPSTVFSDDAGTTPAVIGGPVGAVRDMNGDVVATATGTARPTFGVHPVMGVRNRWNGSASPADTAFWPTPRAQNGLTSTVVGSGTDGGLPYIDVRWQGVFTGSGFHNIIYAAGAARIPTVPTVQWTSSGVARVIAGAAPAGGGLRVGVIEETAPSTFVGATESAPIDGSSDTERAATRVVASGNQVRPSISLTGTVGDMVDVTYRIKGVQFEQGSTRTNYQFNFSQFNITEADQRPVYYLFDDNVDDVMNATIASELTDATIAWASDAGYTIQTGQTIADGSYNVLRDNRLYGFAIAGADLSAGQTSLLEKSLKWAGGIAL